MNLKKAWLVIVMLAVAVGGWLLTHRDDGHGIASGTIEADEVHVASRVGGRVEKLLADEGDLLKPGQLIAQLEANELAARRDYSAALLAELEAGPRPQDIEAAKQDWEALAAELEFAQSEDHRQRELSRQKVVSDTDRDSAASNARALEKKAAAAKERYDVLAAGTRPERIAQARAQLAEINTSLAEMSISSPADCTLETLHVKPGDIVPPNGAVATLLFQNERWVRVYVPETWLGHVQAGQAVDVHVDAFPGRLFTGTVQQISRKAEFTPRNVQTVEDRIKQVFGVKVRLHDDEHQLSPGMSADVSFTGVPRRPG